MRTPTFILVISASLGITACTGGTKSPPAPPSSSASSSSSEEQPAVAGEVRGDRGRFYDLATVETTRRAGTPPAPAGAGPAGRTTEVSAVLNETERRALLDALDDEYRAWATYDQVIRDFGSERPFINIREAEARHIEQLRKLFERYEVALPENSWPGRVSRSASIREACEAGIEAEVANAALYERLMRSTRRQDILAVFGYLQRASQENHLPAFRRCATRGPGRP